MAETRVKGRGIGDKTLTDADITLESAPVLSALTATDRIVVSNATAVSAAPMSVLETYLNGAFPKKSTNETIAGLWNFAQQGIKILTTLAEPTAGYIGFAAKTDGLYQKIGTAAEQRLLVGADLSPFPSKLGVETISGQWNFGVNPTVLGYGVWHAGNFDPATKAPASGSGNYIQNQSASAQTASMWISGNATFGGNIGIGITNPGAKLDVSGNIRLSQTFPEIEFNNGGARIGNANTANTLAFYTGGGVGSTTLERMRISSAGNVGINTITPLGKLHIGGTSSLDTHVYIDGGWGGYAPNINLRMTSGGSGTDSAGRISFYGSDGTSFFALGRIGVNQAGDNFRGNMVFHTLGGGQFTEKMRINALGNVGIGTTTPLVKFVVADDTSLSGDNGQIRIQGYTNNAKRLYFGVDTSATTSYGYIQSTESLVSVRALSLQPSGGNVGIGVIDPWAKLDALAADTAGATLTGATISVRSNSAPTANKGGSIAFGDTGTYRAMIKGMFMGPSGSGGALAFSTVSDVGAAMTERIRIDSTGNVGIGTTSPKGLLQVGATDTNYPSSSLANTILYGPLATTSIGTSDILSLARAYNGGVSFGRYAAIALGTYVAGSNSKARLDFKLSDTAYVADQTIMTLQGDGKVGIGTTAPTSLLQINHSGNGTVNLRIGNDSDITQNTGIYLRTTGIGYIGTQVAAGITRITSDNSAGDTGKGISVLAGGNVGIGTTSPTDTLYVLGTKSSSSNPSIIGVSVSDSTAMTSGVGGGITFLGKYLTGGGEATAGTIHSYKENASSGEYGFGMAFNTRVNAGNNTEKMRITSTGRIGIGMTSPTLKLEVDNTTTGEQCSIGFAPDSTSNVTNIAGKWYGNIVQAIKFKRGADMTGGSMSFWTTPSAGSLTHRLTIDKDGKIGIGLDTPTVILDILSTLPSGQAIVKVQGARTSYITLHDDGINSNGSALCLNYSKSEDINLRNGALLVKNTGNVGIGTTTPENKLQVGSVSGLGYTGHSIAVGDGTNVLGISLASGSANLYSNGALVFAPGSTEKVRISATGNVTINTLADTKAHLTYTTTTGQLSALADGTTGQTLVTNGAGSYTWGTPWTSAGYMGPWYLRLNAGTPSAVGTGSTVTFTQGTNISISESGGNITISMPTAIPDITGYATQTWVNTNYSLIHSHPYLATGWLPPHDHEHSNIALLDAVASAIATQNWVDVNYSLASHTHTAVASHTFASHSDVSVTGASSGDILTFNGAAWVHNYWTGDRVMISGPTGRLTNSSITTTELGHLSGVSSNIQTQFTNKAALSGSTSQAFNVLTLYAASTVSCSNAILNGSDIRLKHMISSLVDAAWTDKINFVDYRFKSDLTNRKRYGVLAQELECIAPELVHESPDGMKSVSYIDLLIAKVARLEQRIKTLEYGS